MGVIDIYWLPHCSTCQKAVKFLEENGAEFGTFHDLKADPLKRKEVERLVGFVGAVEKLFSKRAMKYRAMKLNERVLSDDEMIELMTDEYTFIRRPVIVVGENALAGFSPKKYEAFLNE